MRLWSLHPSLLDANGLAHLWQDSIQAQSLLLQNTSRTDIPCLVRFTKSKNPIEVFSWYFEGVWNEAKRRNIQNNLNRDSINLQVNKEFCDNKKGTEIVPPASLVIPVTDGQLWFEYRKLLNELEHRDEIMYRILLSFDDMNGLPPIHPVFEAVQGSIEKWDTDWYENNI